MKKVPKILLSILVSFVSQSLKSQAFLNGSFEVNTAAACDYNMTNASFNTKMSNCTAYGLGGELDIMQSACPYGPSQSGTWFAALACPSGNTDAFTMMLSAPLVTGTTYSMSFWDKGDLACCPPGMPVIIGLSTVAGANGTTIYTGPTPTGGVWNQRCFSFVAPNNGQHISVRTAGPTRWSHVDNFVLNGSCAVLPIELKYFESQCLNGKTLLKWATASEKNNNFFSVEYSDNGTEFLEIGTVKGAGNSNSEIIYEFTDTQLQKDVSYYRIKQTDYNKSFSFSSIISAERCKNVFDYNFDVFPNPASSTLKALTNIESGRLQIVNMLGQTIFESNISGSETILDISGFDKGIYFIQLISEGKTQSKKFLKN